MIPDFTATLRTIRPHAVCALHGVTSQEGKLWSIDAVNGYVLEIDPHNDQTRILNPYHCTDFIGATGLTVVDDRLWFTCEESIYFCLFKEGSWTPQLFTRLSSPANGIAVSGTTVYVTCQKTGDIIVFNRDSGKEITRLYAPGIGIENITLRDEELWVCDTLEQSVFCLDRATGKVLFSLITPFENPTGLCFYHDPSTAKEILYVTYAQSVPYIRDNPNADPHHELQYRDESFIHPLYFHYYPERKYTLSNGYLIEVSYVEELSPLDPFTIDNLEWRIALPAETDRQKIRSIESIGIPFKEEFQDGQKIAVFHFPQLGFKDRFIFGWKAVLEVWGIKYQITPTDCQGIAELSPEMKAKYLVDNDNLAMDTEIVKRSAEEAIGRETNFLRRVYSIRNYVYDRLSYGIKPHIDTPDIALKRGVGSCGEYLGVLLALARLNGIASRTVGRYKCPPHPLLRNTPLQPDYNHVWMEFYCPGFGWLPMESNPDDIHEGGPYPTRFFMGLAWYHAEMAKNVPFETITQNGQSIDKTRLSIGDLALNHVRFTILEELIPPS